MKFFLRFLSSLFTVGASHDITIRRAWPRGVQSGGAVLILAMVIGITWWIARYTAPSSLPLADAIPASVQEREQALNDEMADLRRQNASFESELSMQEGSQTKLAQHTEALEQENTQLKEELTYLQKLVADVTREAGAKIQDVRLEPQAKSTYRYRILLVQGGNPKSDFEGKVKLLASAGKPGDVAQNVPLTALPGKTDTAADPAVPNLAAPLPVKFKYYQRLEGLFRVPDGTKVQQFTVQVFKKDGATPAATHSIDIK